MGAVVVAYSGGVDSAFLATVAHDTLGGRAIAVTANSPSLPPSSLREAVELARERGFNHLVIDTHEVERADYQANDPNRCFFCKEELYETLAKLPEAEDAQIVNGHNADDRRGDFRPGMNSARKRGVRSPLVEAGLTKAEIRELSREMGLPTWDKPAQACLSSRIPYGAPVTVEALGRIARGEEYLRGIGLRQVRVRHHGDIARIEVEPSDFPRLTDEETRAALTAYFRSIGYAYVTLDLEGYRSGSLNEVLAGIRRKRESKDAL